MTLVQALALYAGLHVTFNRTPSLPMGFYWQTAPAPLHVGDIVRFMPPDRALPYLGAYPPHVALVKQVVGLPGHSVCWAKAQMTVQTQAFPRQPQHPLPFVGCHPVQSGELIVVGQHAKSLDSRQLGAIDQRRVVARLIPLWTWGGAE